MALLCYPNLYSVCCSPRFDSVYCFILVWASCGTLHPTIWLLYLSEDVMSLFSAVMSVCNLLAVHVVRNRGAYIKRHWLMRKAYMDCFLGNIDSALLYGIYYYMFYEIESQKASWKESLVDPEFFIVEYFRFNHRAWWLCQASS